MSTPPRNLTGQFYRCLICGAEVSVVRPGAGKLAPRCCNDPMVLLPQRQLSYYCPVCGAEMMVIREGTARPTPRCCNEPMVGREVAA